MATRHTTTIYKNNKSGHRGVYWKTRSKKWEACLKINKKRVFCKLFDNFDEAVKAYNLARSKYFSEKELQPLSEEQKERKLKENLLKNKDKIREWHLKSKRKLKADIIENYGGKCECCSEKNSEFLTIDHISGNGKQHREEIGSNAIYTWLRKNNYPKDNYRLLCMNCNFARGRFGYCPHTKQKERNNENS